MRIINKSKNTVIAENVILADNFLTRMRGLLGRKSIKSGEALVVTPCNSIHMFFMRFSIDVLFLNSTCQVVSVFTSIRPWRITPICWGAKFAIELPCGTITASGTALGDQIRFL